MMLTLVIFSHEPLVYIMCWKHAYVVEHLELHFLMANYGGYANACTPLVAGRKICRVSTINCVILQYGLAQ